MSVNTACYDLHTHTLHTATDNACTTITTTTTTTTHRDREDKNNAHIAKCKAVRATRDAEYTAALKRAQEAKKLAEVEEHRKREEYFTLHPDERPWHEQVGKSLIDTWTKLTSCCDPTKQHILD
jgi:hypothetical protein